METRLQQRILIGNLALSALLSSAGTSMANLTLPLISKEFDLTFSTVKWVVLSYLIAITVFSLIVGRLGDLKGRRNILLLGLIMFSAGTAISTFSLSFSTLIFGRLIQGFGAAALAVIPIVIVTETLTSHKMGRAIGLLAAMSAVGTATGPSIGGFLLEGFGWRSVFAMMTILGVTTLVISFVFVPPSKSISKNDQQKTDILNSIKSFCSDASLRTHLFSNLFISAVMISTLIIGPFYLTHALHLDPHEMGLVMSAGPITSILSGTLAGYAVDRFGCSFMIKVGLMQSLVGAVSFVFLPIIFGPLGFVLSAILLSLGYQLFLSANSNGLMKSASKEHRGLAAGALYLSRNLGLMSGTYLIGSIFDLFAKSSSSSTTIERSITKGFQISFTFAAAMITVLLFNHLKLQKRSTHEKRFTNPIH